MSIKTFTIRYFTFDFQKFYRRKPQGLNGALKDVGISFEGREHSG